MRKSANGRDRTGSADGRDWIDRAPIGSAPTSPIVAVGASAGGMDAFGDLLGHVPAGSGLAFVLIQHLDPAHPSHLPEALARSTSLPVIEIEDGMRVEPDHVYVVPSHADVGIVEGVLALFPRSSQEPKPHLPIDLFFRALAADRGNQAIGIVLSGTGSDGAQGVRAIKAADGITFAQDPGSAQFSGVPAAAAATAAVDFCLPVPDLARELARVGGHPFIRGGAAELFANFEDEDQLRKALALVRSTVGIDFSDYKPAGIRRRLARRMALHRLTKLDEYVRLLRGDRGEVQALFDDILVHLTSFFREGDALEKLKQRVFPDLLRPKRGGNGAIRIWCAGCSTGEEAYSVLIALLEFLEQKGAGDLPIQLFGTDISEGAIEKARAGFYPDSVVREVSPERLARFFTKREGGFSISKSVRERCAFVKHDLATDTQFSRIDLVCCRNVLIDLGPELRRRVLARFHLALNEPGFLLMGRAENVVDGENLFRVVDRENKIFARLSVESLLPSGRARDRDPITPPLADVPAAAVPDLVRRTESFLLDAYAPPGVIVNARLEILHFRGRTGPYLEPAPGQPQHDLLKMARKGLAADLRIAISQARKRNSTVRRSGVRVEQQGSSLICDLVVIPLASPPDSREGVLAVLFETPAAVPETPTNGKGFEDGGSEGGPASGVDPQRLAGLEDELKVTKEYLQSSIDEHQRSSEELLSINEELVASNEQLQSLNEELQVAKGMLQSANEELSALNHEMQTRNAELNSANSDLLNILASVEVPIVIVDGDRRIRRFTPKARPIFKLLPADVGRPIDDIRPNLAVENLDRKIAAVIGTAAPHEEEVCSHEGRWYRLQIRPYTTVHHKVEGAVLSVVDVDALKRALGAAVWARDYAHATVEAVQVPLVVLTEKLEIVSTNRAFQDGYAGPPQAVGGNSRHDLIGGILGVPALRSSLERVREQDASFQGFELEYELPALGRRWLSLSARSVPMPDSGRLILLAVEDITARRHGEAERARLFLETEAAKASAEDANRTKDIFLATLSHELRTPLSTLLLSAELLRTGTLDQAMFRRTIDAIAAATKAQAQLIDDLLDISRIVTGKLTMELRAVSLNEVVLGAVDALTPTAERKRLEVQVQIDEALPPVAGDPVRLQQVVSNLLTNAIKFTPERGRVRVTVDAVGGRGRICVTDTGVGIESEFLAHIFNRFSQEDRGQTRAHGGLGLGLAIVQYLVEAHGGSVQAESAGKGQGATFTVSVPLMTKFEARHPRDEKDASAEEIIGSVKGVRILVVEDDPGTREALAEMLRLSGVDVQSAESVTAAMDLFEKFKPEILISDIAMPDDDGYSLLARVQALGSDRGGDVPALALTALASADDRRRAFEAGFGAHMAKPVDIDRLLAAVTKLLKPRRSSGADDRRAPGP
jgi:two-component system, chemotaxis family, CheB/CheR fusion protein